MMGPVIPNEAAPVESDPSQGFVNKAAEAVTGIPAWDDILEMPPAVTMAGEGGAPVRVYLSGPMSGYVGHNYPIFNKAAELLRSRGLEVVSPAELGYHEGWDWLDYIVRDLESIKGCQGVVVLPRFYESAGAIIEVMACRRMGMFIWKLDGTEFLGQLREDGSLDYESDDLELIGSSIPGNVQEIIDELNKVAIENWTAKLHVELGAWEFMLNGHHVFTVTAEFLADNPNSSEKIASIIRERATT